MARIDVIMPQMGESIAEGTLSKWMKQVGDAVKRDEPIFEISTDKVDAEIPAPNEGTLAEILVQEGETVEVNTVVARIETEAGTVAAPPATASASEPPAEAPTPPAHPVRAPEPARAAAPPPLPPPPPPTREPASAPILAAASPPRPAPPAAGDGAGTESAEERLRRRSTPLVRKMAAEHDLDISVIPGTGMAGRVTKQDVLTYLERRPAAPAASAPTTAGGPVVAEIHAPLVEAWEGDRVDPWSRIRKLTADHMIMSHRVSAHVASVFEIDYTRVAQVRAKLKKDYAGRGVNLTYLAFITKAVADNIRNHPVVNAAVSGDNTIYRRDVNIGIAVALDWGLIVPVITHADELSLIGIARAINDLGERARTKKLNPDEVQKGTFTITNPGVFGSLTGIPIINQPQTAILAVGSITKQPAVVSLPDGADAIAIRTRGMLSMSYDHRVVDGADADRFLADVRATLENFPDTAA
jgi:2-oxoglutarate dehydrogenase E2 component (dihydrolipoamide succinyltransferase)